MPQKLIDQTTIQPDGRPGDDAFTAFSTCNDNFQDAEARLVVLEAGGGETGDRLDTEIAERTAADAALGARIDAEHSLITQETADRIAADAALAARLIGDNAIINGDFDFWQRGTVFTQDNVYAADRWYTQQGSVTGDIRQHVPLAGENNFPDSVYTLNCNITANASSVASYQVFEQRVEDCRTFATKPSTLSFRVFNAGAAGRKIAVEFCQTFGVGGSAPLLGLSPQVFTLAAGMNYITKTVTLPAVTGKTVNVGNAAVVVIWSSGGSGFDSRNGGLGVQTGSLYFSQIKWEAGAVATPFRKRNLALELMLCQRYFRKSFSVTEVPANNSTTSLHRAGACFAPTSMRISVAFDTPMRGVPTLRFYSAAEVPSSPSSVWGYYNFSIATWVAGQATNVVNTQPTGFIVDVGSTNTNPGSVYLVNGQYTADAEI